MTTDRSWLQAAFRVGDIVSIIEKVPSATREDRSWWKAKLTISKDEACKAGFGKNFEVGLFPSECVKIFDSKPESLTIDRQLSENVTIKTVETNIRGEPISTLKKSSDWHRPRRDRSLVKSLLRRHVEQQVPPVFGIDLVEYLQKTGDDVPQILKKCVEVIELHGIVTGVYRQCGIQSNIQKLRNGFDSGHLPDLSDDTILKDIHSVSSLLKQYFRQLPNPLFTFELYPDFISAYETTDEKQVERFKDIIGRLPCEHYRTAKYLIRHLSKLCQCTHLTDMNSKNLAIVWAPNLFRCPPCIDDGTGSNGGSDSSLLQGLNAQTGLCNYILVHAVYLFALEKDSLSLPRGPYSCSVDARSRSIMSCISSLPLPNGEALSQPDLRSKNYLDINVSPAMHPSFRSITNGSKKREVSAQPCGKWRRMLRGPSVDNAFTSLRTRWKKQNGLHVNDNSGNNVKWRRSPVSDARVSLRAARSASLISFVTKSVEEFRNGVLRSWRHCAQSRDESVMNSSGQQRHSSATAIATELVRRRGLTSFLAADQNPSTSFPFCSRDEYADDGLSSSSDSYRFFGFCDNEPLMDRISLHSLEKTLTEQNWSKVEPDVLRLHFHSNIAMERRRADTAVNSRSSSTDGWSDFARSSGISKSSSSSTSSHHNDCSRYDNVSPGGDDKEARYVETPLSFYDLPQKNIRSVRSNIQLYFL
ncbi:unnamed protein product [Thelazia callipaeda]|uniref:Rho-GAP domain-containing protein n=1 Tax=Thelazia callipaeda TaxID=103827 RepID=A0A0N5CJE4_THECL|nr:unnamed protein product [Thelazia callipaeda]